MFYFIHSYHQKYLLQQHPWLMNALDISPGPELNNSHIATRLNGYVGGYGTKVQNELSFRCTLRNFGNQYYNLI